jgi:hypothetical protein
VPRRPGRLGNSRAPGSRKVLDEPPPENERPTTVAIATGRGKKKSPERKSNTRKTQASRAWPWIITDGKKTIGRVWWEDGCFVAATASRRVGYFRSLQDASRAVCDAHGGLSHA